MGHTVVISLDLWVQASECAWVSQITGRRSGATIEDMESEAPTHGEFERELLSDANADAFGVYEACCTAVNQIGPEVGEETLGAWDTSAIETTDPRCFLVHGCRTRLNRTLTSTFDELSLSTNAEGYVCFAIVLGA
jgi:hypothetical protein